MGAERLASQSQAVSEQLQGAADELDVESQRLKKELEEACTIKNQLAKELKANEKEADAARQEMEELRRVGESQAKELEAAKGCMVEEQQQVSIKLAEAMKQLGKVEEEKEGGTKQLQLLQSRWSWQRRRRRRQV